MYPNLFDDPTLELVRGNMKQSTHKQKQQVKNHNWQAEVDKLAKYPSTARKLNQ